MQQPAISDYWYRTKNKLRGFPPIAAVNSALKAHQLRVGLEKLATKYNKLAEHKKFKYQEDAALEQFRRRHLILKPEHKPKKMGDLRIFWIGTNIDQDESGFLQALRRISEVIEFHNWKGTYGQWYWDEFGRFRGEGAFTELNDKSLKSQLEEVLKNGPVDLLLGQMWANFISKEALAWVHSLGIPIINISMDDRLPGHWQTKGGVRLGAVGLSPETDLVLTTSSETCSWYGLEGCPAIFWPLASDPEIFCSSESRVRDIDVLFIGNKYGIRESIINDLNVRGVHVECYGAGWPNGRSTAEQSAALFKRAKIILGVGTVGYCDDVFTLKLRDFDAPMSGALYLTHRNRDLAQLYEEGKEIECYSNSAEAASKIHYYLEHPEELSRIAIAGHSKARLRDTWNYRLGMTFSRLGLLENFAKQSNYA